MCGPVEVHNLSHLCLANHVGPLVSQNCCTTFSYGSFVLTESSCIPSLAKKVHIVLEFGHFICFLKTASFSILVIKKLNSNDHKSLKSFSTDNPFGFKVCNKTQTFL